MRGDNMLHIFEGKINTGVEYTTFNHSKLKKVKFENFDVNRKDAQIKLVYNDNTIGLSKWVSPKRTRSQPFSRVYNTLHLSKRITVIPIRKDEGIDGDHDTINPITLAWMNLLGVYIVLAYYDDAKKHTNYENKITNQKFNNT